MQVLASMRRGYTREAYLSLIRRTREIIPDVTLSSDFISGRGDAVGCKNETIFSVYLLNYPLILHIFLVFPTDNVLFLL